MAGEVAAGDTHNHDQYTGQSKAGGQDAETIKQVQTKLNEQGHDVGSPDGIMGPKTQNGLKAFQTSKNLKASGQLDKETLSALGVSGSAAGGASAQKSEKKAEGSAATGGSASSSKTEAPSSSGSAGAGGSAGASGSSSGSSAGAGPAKSEKKY